MTLLTPPLTPTTYPSLSSAMAGSTAYNRRYQTRRTHPTSPLASPDGLVLPPPVDIPDLDIPEAALPPNVTQLEADDSMPWRPDMTAAEKDAREAWISESRGRKGLRIVIVTGAHVGRMSAYSREFSPQGGRRDPHVGSAARAPREGGPQLHAPGPWNRHGELCHSSSLTPEPLCLAPTRWHCRCPTRSLPRLEAQLPAPKVLTYHPRLPA